MTSHRLNQTNLRRGALALSALAVGVTLLAGCGGGELVAPDASATYSERDQAALKRATALNASALSARVKGERAQGTPSQ
jgi:hypothetical protein